MKRNNKFVLKLLMALLFIPLMFSVPIVEASEVNQKNQRAPDEYTELAIKPTKVWVVRSGQSRFKHIFYQESGYRGWLTRITDSPNVGIYTNFEGYLYRPDLPYPQPSKVEKYDETLPTLKIAM